MTRTLNDNLAVRMGGTPATWAAAAVNGNWVDMTAYRRALLVCGNGELDGNIVVQIKEATDNAGAGAQNLTGLTGTFANGTDEARVGLIEVRDVDLSAGFDFIAANVTPAATDSFAAFWLLVPKANYPAENTTGDGVAFAVGE